MIRFAIVSALLVLHAGVSARAAVVTAYFTGVVEEANTPLSDIGVGTAWSAQVTFDTTLPPDAYLNLTYHYFAAVMDYRVTLGSETGTSNIHRDALTRDYDAQTQTPMDTLLFGGYFTDTPGSPFTSASIWLGAPTGFLPANTLPGDFTLDDLDSATFVTNGPGALFSGSITSITIVPEPTALALAACGALGFIVRRSRR